MDFCLKDADEKITCLKDFRGKKVVLYFYPKDNTPGCTVQAIEFTTLKKEFEDLNTVVIGISPDTCQSHQKFMVKHDLGIILLSDLKKEVSTKYGTWKEKSMYGKKYFGIERSTFLINESGKIIQAWLKVKAKGHAKKVVEKISAMRNTKELK
ncbi:MAG: peroxiredoxin [Candidatus Altiarchaeota archaeon]|nr:peroxiredoxin [Candidatus Altiarchaeota archaeon]